MRPEVNPAAACFLSFFQTSENQLYLSLAYRNSGDCTTKNSSSKEC